MIERARAEARGHWEGYLVALVVVAAVSVLIGAILAYQRIGNLAMLYLLAVLVSAIRHGRGPAIVASIAAFLAFDWFFVEPEHTFTINDPAEWVALVLFLLTAVVTAQLAARERARAEEAERREREAVLLRAIGAALSEADLDLDRGLRAAEARLAEALGLARARVTLAATPADAAEDDEAEARQRTLPLVAPSGEPVGTLQITPGEQSLAPGGPDGHLLDAVATQLGAAIERIRLRREATEAETLRRTDELKSALLNAVSHDLRTPLASILASAGSLCQHDIAWSDDEKDEFAGAIVEEAQRLNGIVGNLLDLSRIEGGSLRPDKGWYDLGALIDDVVRRVRPRYPEHHFAVDVQEGLPPLYIDWVEIDQVLSNLIENAAKYSPTGTKVWIAARHDGDCVRVQIADRGPGIPREALPYLFTPFYRVAPRGGRPRPKGTGLGLAVARGLIEAHGGRIAVRNRDDGGALFTFTLPVTTPPAEDAPEPVVASRARGG
jgi:two-component system sensor histidine kinase KdpD